MQIDLNEKIRKFQDEAVKPIINRIWEIEMRTGRILEEEKVELAFQPCQCATTEPVKKNVRKAS